MEGEGREMDGPTYNGEGGSEMEGLSGYYGSPGPRGARLVTAYKLNISKTVRFTDTVTKEHFVL